MAFIARLSSFESLFIDEDAAEPTWYFISHLISIYDSGFKIKLNNKRQLKMAGIINIKIDYRQIKNILSDLN